MSLTESDEQASAVERLTPAVNQWVARVDAYNVVDQPSYEGIASLITGLAQLDKAIDATFDPILRAQKEVVRVTTEQRDKHRSPVRLAISNAKQKASTWALAEESRRRAEVAAEQARLRELEDKRRMEEAQALEDAGQTREASEVLDEPTFVAPAPSRKAVAPAAAGIGLRDNWKAEIEDKMAVAKAVAEGVYPLAAIEVSQTYFNARARAEKEEFRGPGVRVWNDRGISRTASR